MLVGLLATVASWQAPTALPATGKATYYAHGVMERVWQYRIQNGHVQPCKECIGAVAMMHSGDIGRKVWIERKGEVLGPFLVVDCAARQDYPGLVKRGVVIEVPFWLAQHWKMAGPVEVKVLDRAPLDESARISVGPPYAIQRRMNPPPAGERM